MDRKIIVMPDSFKGSICSEEAATIIGEAAEKYGFNSIELPIADGGEGSIDCILKILGGKKHSVPVFGPDGKQTVASYGETFQNIAIMEIAESSGITKQTDLHPMTSDTFGFGQLISAALDRGLRDFLICLGGSATTDCGLGMMAALGALFYDEAGKEFVPNGKRLKDVSKIDLSAFDARISESTFTVMSDVENPLFGEKGAAYVFSPQKGANEAEVIELDEGLRHVAPLIYEVTGVKEEKVKGAGAAGGSGYACAAFFKAKIQSGIHAMLDLCKFDSRVEDCDFIVTGEGKLDMQSLMGKVLSGIESRAAGKPIVSFCGVCGLDEDILKEHNITSVEISKGISKEESIKNGPKYLKAAAEKFFEGMEGNK